MLQHYDDVNMLFFIKLIYTVQVMKEIGRTLGKKDWDFSKDPCSGENNWTSSVKVKGFESAVTCNCSFANATICHIVSMYVPRSSHLCLIFVFVRSPFVCILNFNYVICMNKYRPTLLINFG
jgi:hypothetical protein